MDDDPVDGWLQRALESGDYVEMYTLEVEVTQLRVDRCRAEADLGQLGEEDLAGLLAAHAGTADEAIELLSTKAASAMEQWANATGGRPGLLGFRIRHRGTENH